MLIGNPVDFDRIRARYEALKYPTPEEASFNATTASYEGLLTVSGFDTQMVPTTTPGQQVSFSVDPNTGQVTTQIPQYDIPNFQTIYDREEGLIGPDGLPSPVSSGSIGGGQAIPARVQKGDGRENLEKFLRGGSAPLGAVGTEFIGDTGFRINADGTVTKLDEDSLDYKFNKFMYGLLSNTPGNIAKNVLGLSPTSISDVAEQVGDQFGDEAGANFFKEAALARPSGALTDDEAAAARREAAGRSQTGSKLGDRAAAGQAGKKAGPLGKGQYGGR